MFKHFFLFEIKNALKQPMIYIFLGLLALLTFGATASDNIQIGGSVGNVLRNAPHVITVYTTVMTIFGLLMAAAFYNNAALRDFSNEFNEILFSTPLKKSSYFFGRFCGALLLSTIPLLGVFLGAALGSIAAPLFGWIDADRFGSFYLETFTNNYFLFILPNMFIAGSVIFALANIWKSTVISFVGALAIIMGYIISGNLISDIDNETLGALSDTFGIRAYSIYSKYYTPIEKNTLSPGFSGLLLWNRLIWISFGGIILLASYLNFSFQEKNKRIKKQEKSTEKSTEKFILPVLEIDFGRSSVWLQFKSFFLMNFLSIVKNVTFRILFLFSAILLITGLIGGFEYYGLQSYPLTYKLIDDIDGNASLFVIIILVFFSGELIWRDRNSKIHEVIDATPHTSLISLAAKTLSLISLTVLLQLFFIFCGVVYQLVNGYFRIELEVYFLDFFYANFLAYAIWSGVMITIQVLVNNKYIGYFVSISVIFIWSIVLEIFDVSSFMLTIAAGPSTLYSDMNAFGPGLYGAMMFNLYWILFSILCLLIAGALWNRGLRSSLKDRLNIAKKQVPRNYRPLIFGTAFVWLVVTGFVFYNTHILNPYKTSDEYEQMAADYEKQYKKYQNVPLPKIVDAKYSIDLFPYERNVDVKAVFKIVNETQVQIDSIHFNIDKDWSPAFELPNAEIVFEDKEMGYLILGFDEPMLPGDTIEMIVTSQYISKGFKNGRGSTSIINNGTFLNNFEILPSLGYDEGQELSEKNTRKKYDLKPKIRMPKLEANCGANCMRNYLSQGASDYINFETTISTAGDQIAIAPGSLTKYWEEKGRNYYQYKVDHPSQHFMSFISAKYEVAKRKWQGIDIEIYYDAKHHVNIEMMLDAVERSLAYYTENFGPYMHKQCRIIEFPRYATFAQAFPGTMPYSEAFGFVVNLEDETENNVIDAVISHEMAHQWWAHQIVGANMQGATMFSESFAEYSALMTMKSISKTPMKMREFLKYDHNRYLRGRGGEIEAEQPLYKVENQSYIHYGKGAVILYALQDYIGEEKVNRAMQGFLEEYKYQPPPYPTSLDFMKYLEKEVPDSLQYLITDWFKEITLYDNRMTSAVYAPLENGKFEVTLEIESYKMRADSLGNETKIAIHDWIDIGVFTDEEEEQLLYQKRVLIDQEHMNFTFEVDSLPMRAAIDPRMLLIDRIYDDNIKDIKMSEL
ncbi:M1 family aminopeptidase [Cyclobacteriaceae bacterium]|nr:M1 family aminopeptidase [Cyclobacteriaceae bacterium]